MTQPPGRVHVLPDDLANQIAAGEVVERPASVVKELVENALDARARRIRVDIEGGGVTLVRVTDDGSGMDRKDATLAVLRHATSKIGSIDDLRRIQSFGFRGEALPSIASVSRFSLRTRTHEDDEGTLVRIEGGSPADVGPCGVATGTSIEVRDLFFNVPARRKFLRAVSTESAHVTEVVEAAALCRPDVTLVLARDGRVAREWLRTQSREERARDVFDDEPLAACRGERGPLAVEAFLSRPERARAGATRLLFFVNGRPVKDRTLARMVANAYGSVLEPGRYPVGVVHVDLPPELVDVNVHPQKAEVRFADGRAIQDALYKIIAAPLARAFGLPAPGASPWAHYHKNRADEPRLPAEPAAPPPPPTAFLPGLFGKGPAVAPADSSGPAPFGQRKQKPIDEVTPPLTTWSGSGELPPPEHGNGHSGQTIPSAPEPEPDPWGLAADAPLPVPTPAPPPTAAPPRPMPYPTADERAQTADRPGAFGSLSFVAQVRRTFLVCEGQDGLFVLDQHAAAERVTFERLRRSYETRAVASQRLLIPEMVTVTAEEAAIIEEAQDAIGRTGLEVSLRGVRDAAITAVPQILSARATPAVLLRDLLSELSRVGERAFSGAIDLALATMACHGSIRAGDAVSKEEAEALFRALDEVDFAGHCPHGRPVVMRIRWAELEQKVGRR
ncbi:DNA mismatch repair endonuclease MutL [Polyangium sp. 6x1]|uniref:DNA mismatch repair endonuclease MutL n=1 Tax=Polyangium sp. 6x1 TaxID=3042689 RepID=UPI002482207B|nr:DNA mismatch repair endonuclease MutL [Polyangium sp. 6x1]MDI1443350.1 DNA mismatch repair endonuclease MutL [Polyangium sp. 6x1]